MIEQYAKKTFLALKNPYQTVIRTYPKVIDEVNTSLERWGYACYTGYKQTETIPKTLEQRLHRRGFLKHTDDLMALGGRAVDLNLVNPLTGRWMSGSSSGTALNVFYGINDLGVGTDGGGSVLAPAAALNLYGFISPLIETEYLAAFKKVSTDGIEFSPSIGFIARDMQTLCRCIRQGIDLLTDTEITESKTEFISVPDTIDIFGKRESLILYVKDTVKAGKILVSEEGPVDLLGMGDSLFGHFSEETEAIQKMSRKGLMRIANMCNVSAIVVPAKELGRCTLYLCDNNPEDIAAMLTQAEAASIPGSPLTERYFMNLDMYF